MAEPGRKAMLLTEKVQSKMQQTRSANKLPHSILQSKKIAQQGRTWAQILSKNTTQERIA